ncbi:MAG: hypothetical protein R3E58_17635 [Phycisphaerae bacterium]
MGTELEIFDDTIEPYDSMHLTGRWNALRSAEHTLDLTAGFRTTASKAASTSDKSGGLIWA